MRRAAGGWLLVPWLLAAGCAVPPADEGFTPVPQVERPVVVPGRDTPPAVRRLIARAREAARAGRLDRAEALLERAVRIDPRNPVLWHYMARVHLHQGRAARAEGLAAKSNSLARGDRLLQAANWRVIAHARAARGDAAGARAAEARAEALGAGR